MPTYSLERIATGFGLLEGPVWHPKLGVLAADVPGGGVFAFKPGAKPELVIPHRKGIGGMALHANGGLIVGGRNIGFKRLPPEIDGGKTPVLLDNTAAPDIVGFNDLTTDPQGRIYAGSLGFVAAEGDNGRTGFLHRIDLDGSSTIVSDGIRLTNGLGFSPDGKRLYHSDSRSNLIRVYDVNDDGSLSTWRSFTTVETGIPDGLAVAADGRVWVALAYGGAVTVYTTDGREVERIPVPIPMPTSLCFSGPDLRQLTIVCGAKGAPEDLKGCVYVTSVDVPGLPRAPARVKIPGL